MGLRGIIFDLDGTLADTFPVVLAAYRDVFREFAGRDYTDDELIAMFGLNEEGLIRRMAPDRWREGMDRYLEVYERVHAALTAPFPGIKAALRLLAERGVALAIVTGKGVETAAMSLALLGLAPHFAVVETGSAEGPIKPASIRKVLAAWRMAPEDTAYVGDAPSDMRAAREVGVVPLGAAWATTARADSLEAEHPSATFRTVEEFISWIDANVAARDTTGSSGWDGQSTLG